MPTHASASLFFGVAGDGSGAPSVIDAPERNPAAAGGSRDASASGMAPCAGVLRSFVAPQCAPRTLAPLGPSASCHVSGLRKCSALDGQADQRPRIEAEDLATREEVKTIGSRSQSGQARCETPSRSEMAA